MGVGEGSELEQRGPLHGVAGVFECGCEGSKLSSPTSKSAEWPMCK
jgi:hypothetical protein